MTDLPDAASFPTPQPDRLFRLLVETVHDYAIFLLDPEGNIASWNAGAERLKGYSADEIVGKHFSVLYPDEEVRDGRCERELEEAARVGRVEDEGWRVRKGGERFWASVVITALRDPSGTFIGFAKITRDLTERRRAEEQRIRLAEAHEASRVKDEFLARERDARRAAEEARRSLETTLRSIGDAVIATDAAGNVTMMNPVAEQLTGWELADARGRPLRGIFHIINEESRRLVESPVDRVLREGIVVGLANHTRLIARDGSETPISDSGAPIRDDTGGICGVVLVFRDASTEARESGRRAFLAEATSILVSSLNARQTLARVAEVVVPRLADWCMIDVLEEEGSSPVCVAAVHVDPLKADLVDRLRKRPVPARAHFRGLMSVLNTGRSVHHPVVTDAQLAQWVDDDEQLRLLRELRVSSVVIVPLTTGRRVAGALTLVHSDPMRRYDAEDLEFAEELGRRAGAAIENARLYAVEQRARDLADSASHMKDEFLATVSHELRTPLTSILGWTRMLASAGLADQKRVHAIETIERNAHAMTQLIEDLLDVSRIVSGKMRIDVGRVDLPEVLQAAVDGVRPAADAKGIVLEQELDSDVGPVHGDAARLQQVVWNLLSNAVKFTPRRGRVHIALRQRHSHAEIVVADTGVGIEPRFLPHVFEPFRQADATMRRASGGLGLGLAIVKHLVEQHGGTVEAESEGRDHGSTFVVSLPIPGVLGRGAERAASPTPGAPLETGRLDHVHVLVVEDDPDTREMLREVLGACGARVTVAGSVAEGMEAFARDTPDVLVSDLGMPGETGIDLIHRVRALPAGAGGRVPAAALTAYSRPDDRRATLAAGFELHIAKPVDPSELCSTVATLSRLNSR